MRHAAPSRGFDADFIPRGMHINYRLKSRPCIRNTWLNHEKIPLATNAQNALDASPVHPSSGPRVPGPATAPGMRRHGIDIGGNDVGLDLVAVDLRRRACMIDWIEQRKQPDGLIAISHFRERENPPHPRRP